MKIAKALCGLLISTPLLAEEIAVTELEDVVVSESKPQSAELIQPASLLSEQELRIKAGRSLGDTLKDQPGFSNQSFGPGVGAPVIRGQAGPRVRVLSNGIGSNDASAVSPDHAISTEALLAESIEVLRGPASLLYSGGAMGGVVNVLDNRIPGKAFERVLGAALEQRFDSVADETSTAMKVEGSKDRLAYHLDGFFRHRQNMAIGGRGIDSGAVAITDPSIQVVDNPRGYLPNTGAEAISGSAGASWLLEQGFAGAAINHLENNYGIAPNGAGQETTRIVMRQDKYDFKSEFNKPLPGIKKLGGRLGYTDYQHTEMTNGSPGAFYSNQSYEGRLEIAHEDIGPVRGMVGYQAQASDFNAIEKTSGASIVPRSDINSHAFFALESFDSGALSYQLAARVEPTSIQPDGLSGLSYTPVSAAASAKWRLDARNSLNLAMTRASRAPQVQELLANGYHDATRSYEKGDLALREEVSYNLDLGYRFKADWLRAELDVFHNWAGDYIHQRRNGEYVNEEGDSACGLQCVPVLVSSQADAIFKGYEAKLIVPMMENRYGLLDLTLFSDYTRGQFVDGRDIPRLPPLRYGMQLDYLQDGLAGYLRLTRGEQQSHVGEFETVTEGYFLLNAGVNYQLKAHQDVKLMLFAKGNNLLNQNIRNASSYLRNFAPEAGRGAEVGFRLSY